MNPIVTCLETVKGSLRARSGLPKLYIRAPTKADLEQSHEDCIPPYGPMRHSTVA